MRSEPTPTSLRPQRTLARGSKASAQPLCGRRERQHGVGGRPRPVARGSRAATWHAIDAHPGESSFSMLFLALSQAFSWVLEAFHMFFSWFWTSFGMDFNGFWWLLAIAQLIWSPNRSVEAWSPTFEASAPPSRPLKTTG